MNIVNSFALYFTIDTRLLQQNDTRRREGGNSKATAAAAASKRPSQYNTNASLVCFVQATNMTSFSSAAPHPPLYNKPRASCSFINVKTIPSLHYKVNSIIPLPNDDYSHLNILIITCLTIHPLLFFILHHNRISLRFYCAKQSDKPFSFHSRSLPLYIIPPRQTLSLRLLLLLPYFFFLQKYCTKFDASAHLILLLQFPPTLLGPLTDDDDDGKEGGSTENQLCTHTHCDCSCSSSTAAPSRH